MSSYYFSPSLCTLGGGFVIPIRIRHSAGIVQNKFVQAKTLEIALMRPDFKNPADEITLGFRTFKPECFGETCSGLRTFRRPILCLKEACGPWFKMLNPRRPCLWKIVEVQTRIHWTQEKPRITANIKI